MTRSHYYFKDDEFVIEDYDRQKPFASFLPSLSGTWGIPLWAYYTNRGQGIAGFGVENKDGAIMDFVPANVSYARTELQGFRTFIKIDNHVSELFSSVSEDQVHRRMRIAYNALSFEEVNKTLGIRAVVRYQTTTNQPYPGLVRTLDLYNLSGHPKSVEVLDGLATIWPYRNDDSVIKAMTNLAVAWFDVSHTSRGVPFYKNRSTTHDSAAIGTVESGHFYAAFALEDKRVLPVIYDPDIIFGTHTSQLKPVNFIKRPLEDLLKIKQVCENKKLCAFSAYTFDLEDAISLGAVIGKATDMAQLEEITESLCPAFFKEQRREALELTERLLEDVACETAYPIFDAYVKQCYLDNFLRGGYPLLFEGAKEPIIYHVYSRIHGDMEREYNNFYLEPTYFSHGNGNFRDVNQNRRNDVYFVKEAGLFNLRMFVDLIQLDGHNPLTVKGSKFRVEKKDRNRIMKAVLTGQRRVSGLLEGDFSPGALMMAIDHKDISLGISKDEFLKLVLRHALQENHAAFGHGYWVDHWTYNMDLVESYLNIFPEALEGLMFEEVFKYFRSGYKVLPRHKKYVKTGDGKIRQYDALVCDDEKLEAENFDAAATNWHRYKNGQVVSTSLATKLLVLAVQKITDLDPSGLGIMMNSDKPGWNDAMNGLPGLFGSSISEVVELKRMIDFLRTHLSQFKRDLQMPVEVLDFIASYGQMLALRLTSDTYTNELHYWESVQTLKEAFLVTIDGPLSGDAGVFDDAALMGLLEGMNRKVNDALERAGSYGEGILPSYFIHEAVRYSEIPGQTNLVNGLQCVAVHEWSCRVLPLFLEAPARYLKQLQCVDEARSMYLRIKDSQLYDKGSKCM